MDGIIFDLDGTLWNATEQICKTWNMVLKDYPGTRAPITVEELEGCMGLLLPDIGRRLFPNEIPKIQEELINKCCDMEVKYLSEHGGVLYPDEEKTLSALADKYKLFIVSNCQSGYIESFFKGHSLGKYFTDCECAGNTGMEKGDNIRLIIKRNRLVSPVYTGDTQNDRDSAAYAKVPFVYAAYGFGRVNGYDFIINSFSELTDIF